MRKWFLSLALLAAAVPFVPAQSERPIIREISAVPVSDTQIRVSWRLPDRHTAGSASDAEIALYRATFPLAGSDTLKEMQPVALLPATATEHTDSVPAYREYYYAAMVRPDSGQEYTLVIPAVNATAIGVRPLDKVKEEEIVSGNASAQEMKPARKGELRELPLPYLGLKRSREAESVIQGGTRSAAVALGQEDGAAEKVEPHVFRNEQLDGLSGEELILRDIIQNQFLAGKYAETITLLNSFLQLNRGEDTAARGVFYLGQSYFYSGNHRSALGSFLLVQDVFPELTTRWIQLTLDRYRVPQDG